LFGIEVSVFFVNSDRHVDEDWRYEVSPDDSREYLSAMKGIHIKKEVNRNYE